MMRPLNTLCISCEHIHRAIHCEDWSRQKIDIERKEVTVPGTITRNGVTLRQGFEVMLKTIAPETEVIGIRQTTRRKNSRSTRAMC